MHLKLFYSKRLCHHLFTQSCPQLSRQSSVLVYSNCHRKNISNTVKLNGHFNVRNVTSSYQKENSKDNKKFICNSRNTKLENFRNYTDNICSLQIRCNSSSTQTDNKLDTNSSRYIETNFTDVESDLIPNMLVYEDFISEEEENSLIEEIEPYMRKLRYEFDHWDDAIHGYRETERRHWSQKNKEIISRTRDLAFPPETPQLAHVHILDLKDEGYIKPHIDAVRFCGNTIAGLCLLSSCVMRLVHDKQKDRWANILLKQRSLYIMKWRHSTNPQPFNKCPPTLQYKFLSFVDYSKLKHPKERPEI